TSNSLHNAFMEAGGKDRLPMLAPGIDNDIHSAVNACPNACEMWKAIKRLKQGESINVQDLETNLSWEFRKFTSRDEWQRFVTLVKQSQELKTVSYHKLYDIMKQHQNEVNELRAEKIARTTNPLALITKQAATRNKGKSIVNSPPPIYDQEPSMVAEDDEMSKDKEIDKHMALISLSGAGYDNQRLGNVAGARETVGTTVQVDWRDDTDDESEDQELEAHYMYMAQIQEVSLDAVDSGLIFDTEPVQKNEDDYDLANERELLVSLIEKLKCEIDDSKNRNKFLETSNKVLVDKLKGEIEDFKTKYKSLESSNTHFKEANNKLLETNALMYNDLKKFQAKLDRRNDVEYASKVEIDYSLERKDFSKSKSVTKNNVSNDFSKPVTAQILPPNKNTNVLALGMYKLHSKPTQTRTSQLPNDFRKTNKHVSFSTRVIPTTSVSRPKFKSNPMEDRVLLNNSQGKKQEVEDHHRNVKFSKNKTSVTACNDSLKAKTSNVNFVCATCGKCVLNVKHYMCVLQNLNSVNSRTKMPIDVPVSTREPKRTIKQSVTKPLRKIVASESNQKPRNTTRKLYEHISKACSWWYPKFTPPRYTCKPKSKIGNVNPNVSMPLINTSRTANILEPMTLRRSTVSKTTLYSNYFAARRDYLIHRRIWVLKAQDRKSQVSN
nr:hypothetical protein [Tanacetum cinerariifolium]